MIKVNKISWDSPGNGFNVNEGLQENYINMIIYIQTVVIVQYTSTDILTSTVKNENYFFL